MDPVNRYVQDTTPLEPAEQQVLALFQQLECGRLRLTFPSGHTVAWAGALPGPEAELTFTAADGLAPLAARGLRGLAHGFAEGHWHSRDLVRLLYLLCRNPLLFPAPSVLVPRWPDRLRRLLRSGPAAETPALPPVAPLPALTPAFAAPWLGEALDDGPGLFLADSDTAALAQATATELLLKALGAVRTADHLLEIGGGWGALSESLCRSGARLTVQSSHAATARHIHARLARLSLKQPAVVKQQPLTALRGRYDRIIWAERLSEPLPDPAAWGAVFRQLKTLLKQGGRLVIQMTTAAPQTPAGLPLALFPDGTPPAAETFRAAADAAWLTAETVRPFGPETARLYGLWRLALAPALQVDTAAAQQAEIRRWLYRLAAHEAGHLAGVLTTAQHLFTHRQESRPIAP